jgi:uncharacterized protein
VGEIDSASQQRYNAKKISRAMVLIRVHITIRNEVMRPMIEGGPEATRLAYNFVDPLDLDSTETLFREIVATHAFKRLRSIRFLGGIDYLLVRVPNGSKVRYTRYQHSLGVARLALLYANARRLAPNERRLIYIAALLHDIGHAPLSHSLEPVFYEYFGLEHHRATQDVIAGRVPIGRQLYETLREHRIDIERVIAILIGAENSFDDLFNSPINFDTVDAILRAQTYARPKAILPSPERIIEAIIRRQDEDDCRVADEFWGYKDQVYRTLINARSGVLADFACQVYMRRNTGGLSAEFYYATEEQIFKKLVGLRELLVSRTFESSLVREVDAPIVYLARRFIIDNKGDFFNRDDRRRYVQLKEHKSISPREPHEPVVSPFKREIKQDLFDDDCIRSL